MGTLGLNNYLYKTYAYIITTNSLMHRIIWYVIVRIDFVEIAM